MVLSLWLSIVQNIAPFLFSLLRLGRYSQQGPVLFLDVPFAIVIWKGDLIGI